MKEKIFVEINGIKQGMFLQSENIENPVLLFLHGGPGSPEIAFEAKYPTGLDKLFTVCWWEQRGSGISYSSKISAQQMTPQQLVSDTIEVVNYLKKRFNKEKVYLMGHSWGTLLGVLAVQRAPELFHAYIGVGQVVRQDESERLAYTYMLEQFSKAGNQKMVRRLEKYPIDKGGEISMRYLGVRSEGMMKLGIGVMRNLKSMAKCVAMVLTFKGYTLKEKLNFPRGSGLSLKNIWDFVIKTDLTKTAPVLEVPVYILHGKYDYQVSHALAQQYADVLKAPVKGFYTFENSAHSPCFEESGKMCCILKEDVLSGGTALADSRR